MKCGVIIQGHLYLIQVNVESKPSWRELSKMAPYHIMAATGIESEWHTHLGALDQFFFLLKNAEYNSMTYLQLK